MKRWIVILLCFTGLRVSADVVFSGLDLSTSNRLLFSAETNGPVYGSYKTLFEGDVSTRTLSQLTFFPEKVSLLQGGSVLQIQNRFGVFRTGKNLSSMESVAEFPSFVSGAQIQNGKLQNIKSSPDGKYLLYYRQKDVSYGDLVLLDVKSKKEVVVSENTGFSFDDPVSKWSLNSKYFIFAKNDTLYYYSIDQLIGDRVMAEEYRQIGPGTLNSVNWSLSNDLFYLKGSRVYRILPAGFFTKSLYNGIPETGSVIGKIPFNFDANFDSFTVSPDGRKILLDKSGRNLFLYFLQGDDYLTIGTIKSLPYLFLPRNTRIKSIIWSKSNIITILAIGIHNGEQVSSVFRIDLMNSVKSPAKAAAALSKGTVSGDSRGTEHSNTKGSAMTTSPASGGRELVFRQTGDENITEMSLSPDETAIALMGRNGIEIRNYQSWNTVKKVPFMRPIHILWVDSSRLVIAGVYTIVLEDLKKGTGQIINLSQAGEYGFTKNNLVYAKTAGNIYEEKDKVWTPTQKAEASESRIANSRYRVYLEKNTLGSYRNLVMVRDIEKYGTKALFPSPVQIFEPFPKKDEPTFSGGVFSHGSRIRRREVSLVFNCIDNVEGLTEILKILRDYNIKTTFFLNGDFIRRNPDAVKELGSSGHEIGSLFFAYFNMTDAKYKIDSKFVKQGLGRNEDEYFDITGKELSLLWHAPFYYVNSSIIKSASEMDYRYVGRDIDPLDWVPFGDCSIKDLYKSSREIIETVIKDKKPGSIIPIRVGETPKGRKDYLFQNLDLLINGLIARGYTIVPVTTLMEHAK